MVKSQTNANLIAKIDQLQSKVSFLEEKFSEMGYSTQRLVQSQIHSSYISEPQAETLLGPQLCLCVSTFDPLGNNRVRFFHPGLHSSDTPMKALPFADPVSPMGGFDDTGLTWVPPAGSLIIVMFIHGNRESPLYFGTTWYRNRKSNNDNNNVSFEIAVPEWNIWQGTRKGYLVGKNDESQVFPPWNTWNYNNFDVDTITDFENDPNAKMKATFPHIYGYKTPEKAYIRHHDGDRKCNLRWKHTEIASSRGNFIIMKDDHLHPAGQWCHPSLGGGGGDASFCGVFNDLGELTAPFGSTTCCDCGDENCPGGPTCAGDTSSRFANPYFKRKEEGRPYVGPNTPLNPKTQLPQSGIRIQSLSGHHFEFDDSVDQPTGKPTWDLDFDFGCSNRFVGRCWWQSATGHYILMSDHEDVSENRSEKNLIRLASAAGNYIELNDHTVDKDFAGEKRGVRIGSTAKHELIMSDEGNKQKSPTRKNGGKPENSANNAYVILRSGYGIQIHMNDYHDQQTADKQFFQILTPQVDNDRGPHALHMQVRPQGEPGITLLRSGGVLWLSSYDDSIEIVGSEEKGDLSNKYIDVSGHIISRAKELYININKTTVFKTNDFIFLLAGEDCKIESQEEANDVANQANSNLADAVEAAAAGTRITKTTEQSVPCIYPVMVGKNPWKCPLTGFIHFGVESLSERLFGSALPGKDDPQNPENQQGK